MKKTEKDRRLEGNIAPKIEKKLSVRAYFQNSIIQKLKKLDNKTTE